MKNLIKETFDSKEENENEVVAKFRAYADIMKKRFIG